ncbi:MAG TPA: cupin domain-containing protein [Gaiellaceae bacterium]|jgi:uncharacterized cupin superfamily protein
MVPEATLSETDHGLVPESDGWFVLNVRDAPWRESKDFGSATRFEGRRFFPEIGINVRVLAPGRPNCLYHGEADQESILVLSGECILLVEGEERRLRPWDFVHLPPWTEHVLVGAEEPCTVVMVGARHVDEVIYPVSALAARHGASAERETPSPEDAYAAYAPPETRSYREGDLP